MILETPGDALATCLLDELARCGVKHVCLSPGSRSTPLALAADRSGLSTHVSIDERSSAFLAVGIARATGAPAAVVSTSGTAAANFLPAVAEASAGSVPLIVLTADRPPELRDTGANQTIDQIGMYGRFVRWFCELGVPEDRPGLPAYWRSVGCRAWAESTRPDAGPVHLNVAFREPLVGSDTDTFSASTAGRVDGRPWTQVARAPVTAAAEDVDWLSEKMGAVERGLILAGAGEVDPAGVHTLAASTGWPVLAEPASGLRFGPQAVAAYEALLRSGWADDRRPDFVLRTGKLGISRVVNSYFDDSIEQALIDPAGHWLDSERAARRIIRGDASVTCHRVAKALGARGESPWTREWLSADAAARSAIDRVLDSDGSVSEPRTARDLAAWAPSGSTLIAAASMPVRDLDWFMAPRHGLRVLGNRGANGIDGFVSTAIGVALSSGGPVFALAGDLSMLHDQNGLLVARAELVNLVFVLLNNDGGGIFSFLPQAAKVEGFERLFGTPHGVDFGGVAGAYGCGHHPVRKAANLVPALEAAVAAGGTHIVEVQTDRDANVKLHRALWEAVAADVA